MSVVQVWDGSAVAPLCVDSKRAPGGDVSEEKYGVVFTDMEWLLSTSRTSEKIKLSAKWPKMRVTELETRRDGRSEQLGNSKIKSWKRNPLLTKVTSKSVYWRTGTCLTDKTTEVFRRAIIWIVL